MNSALGQKIGLIIETFIVDHAFFFIVLGLLFAFAMDYYHRYLKVIKDTDHIDLIKRYVKLQMLRRYR